MDFTKEQKEQNTLIAMSYLTGKGYTPMQAAAIVGNLTAESYMNPDTPRGDGGTALGLAQWRFERADKFIEIIGKHIEESSLKEQLDFVDWELRNTHKKAGKLLLAAKTLEEATALVDKYYERSAGLHGERRLKFARAALENWKSVSGKAKEAGTAKNQEQHSRLLSELLESIVELFKRK